MALKKTLVTAEQLLEMPEAEKGWELIDGDLVEMTPGAPGQGRITSRLDRRLGMHVEDHGLGEVITNEPGFILHRNPDTVRAPDVAFVARERVPASGVPDTYWELAPDLVVEVVSPSDRAGELQAKAHMWLQAGVKMVWVVYPATRTIMVYEGGVVRVLRAGDRLEGGSVVPGFSCPVRDIF